ncbi:lipase 3 [Fopius arisanus]|uniref:Lipase n=1 Tax=Fopius arisanus TaxID=64838 RepID=A0A0C9RUL6_9HYME|nr:PREDICTED: lipase 3-like [Fopius arisanus]
MPNGTTGCLVLVAILWIGSVTSRFTGFNRKYSRSGIIYPQRYHRQSQISDNDLVNSSAETFIELVSQAGYEAEEHAVTTEDGYILTAHRIPSGPKSPAANGKPVVLLLHGLLGASDVWVLRGSRRDLAFMLVDEGYDVWVFNARGNFYSRRHERLSPDNAQFWRFSWHEIGTYDTAATIDYILSITGQSQVSLVGYSMGGTVELVLLSKRPEYNLKVNVVLLWAPVAIVTHDLPGLFASVGIRYGNQIEDALRLLNRHELFSRNSINMSTYARLCLSRSTQSICQRLVQYLTGLTNFEAFDLVMLPRLLNHYPQGTSVDTFMHYRQITISGKFQQFDFGPKENLFKYQSVKPPEYPLDKISAPCYLYYAANDPFTTRTDIDAVRNKLLTTTVREIQHSKFSHLDFLFLNETEKFLYNDVLNVLNDHNIPFNGTQNIINA